MREGGRGRSKEGVGRWRKERTENLAKMRQDMSEGGRGMIRYELSATRAKEEPEAKLRKE